MRCCLLKELRDRTIWLVHPARAGGDELLCGLQSEDRFLHQQMCVRQVDDAYQLLLGCERLALRSEHHVAQRQLVVPHASMDQRREDAHSAVSPIRKEAPADSSSSEQPTLLFSPLRLSSSALGHQQSPSNCFGSVPLSAISRDGYSSASGMSGRSLRLFDVPPLELSAFDVLLLPLLAD